jgi:thiosulfate reductase cytochrome b subunit
VFVFFPLMIWTGLGMSPAVTSVFPWLATSFGDQQSARTIHFSSQLRLSFLFWSTSSWFFAQVLSPAFGP